VPSRSVWNWLGPVLVLLIAVGTRLWNLGTPHVLVFDETFYVKDAWTLWNNGYESTWLADADKAFNAGNTVLYTQTGSFVVHPELGKWLIALGMGAFGANNAFGWRIAVAIAGILIVALIMLVAKRLTGSMALATIAGFLIAIDGHAIVLSRVGLLDNFVTLFSLLGFLFIVIDRQRNLPRLLAWVNARRHARPDNPATWGPTLWARPYLLLAGLSFGLAISIKWSGLYFLAAFAVYVVVMDALDRRRVGLPFWFTASVLKQAPATFLLMVPIAAVTYLSSWTSWILTSGGYDRQLIAENPSLRWTGIFSWAPDWFQSLWAYHVSAYNFHVSLTVPHSYQANPLTWLFMTRPTSMFYVGDKLGENGCTFDSCASAITALANPLIWWGGTAAVLYMVYRLFRFREWQVGIILMGMVAGYLPWLMYLNRTIFQFYGIVYEPYMVLALTFVFGIWLGKASDDPERRRTGRRWVIVFLVLASLLSIFFFPLWTGMQIPYWYWQIHMWLPGWI
jgi:dolichyl-phosphate-mannose-protein mannosyltransferase